MAFVFHTHPSPSYETTHHTMCVSVNGSDWEHSCIEIASRRNREKFGCIHRNPQGLCHEEESFISDVISQRIFARGQGGYAQEKRP